ncbi:MAG: hypothetical protein AABY43_00495 [Candidatus Omnitrophota bacterium]|mgnify:CR=1 FL=1
MQTREINKEEPLASRHMRASEKHHPELSKKKWQKPCLEDVSGKIMAQPYIRFT